MTEKEGEAESIMIDSRKGTENICATIATMQETKDVTKMLLPALCLLHNIEPQSTPYIIHIKRFNLHVGLGKRGPANIFFVGPNPGQVFSTHAYRSPRNPWREGG